MFMPFFENLRRAGVPVSLREYLSFLEAMKANLITYDVEGFYYLARTAMVKDERHIDRFDRAFAASFEGLENITLDAVVEALDLPEDWLRKQAELHLSEEEMKKIKQELPTGMEAHFSYDATAYIDGALKEVVSTLVETLLIVVVVIMSVMVVVRRGGQQPGAGAVDAKSEHSDQDCLIEADGDRIEEALDALARHEGRETDQEDGAGERRQAVDLARSEREAPILRVPPGIDIGRDDHPDQPAMERHATPPHLDDLARIGEVLRRLIEQHEPQPPADQDAEDDPRHQRLKLLGRHRWRLVRPKRGTAQRTTRKPPAQNDADDVGQRVPAQGKLESQKRDRENLGRYIGECQCARKHVRLNACAGWRGQPCLWAVNSPYRVGP